LYKGQVSADDYLSAYKALDEATLASQAMANEYGPDWNGNGNDEWLSRP
jgi:hypothetical protein